MAIIEEDPGFNAALAARTNEVSPYPHGASLLLSRTDSNSSGRCFQGLQRNSVRKRRKGLMGQGWGLAAWTPILDVSQPLKHSPPVGSQAPCHPVSHPWG